MIVIADSGSTKTDWVLMERSGSIIARGTTAGLNPHFHSSEDITSAIRTMDWVESSRTAVEELWFYGSGCSTDSLRQVVEVALHKVFHNAEINVDHDQHAAAFALYNGVPEIACILGTGSNSCAFNGELSNKKSLNLGYILGDEGSGAWIGRQLLRAFYYRQMPGDLQIEFGQAYGTDHEVVLFNLFQKPHANLYLAGFARFAGDQASHPWIQELIAEGFAEFIDIHVRCYPEAPRVEINFTGSIAHQFSDILELEVRNAGFRLGRIEARPIEGLVRYHTGKFRV